jgi:hypothetical protein
MSWDHHDLLDAYSKEIAQLKADLAAARALTTEPVAWQLITHKGFAEHWIRFTQPSADETNEWRPLYALAGKDAT